jgi:branched-subunit amino acid ABC-type transport system permease component
VTQLAQALVGGILIGGLDVAISIGFSLSFGVLDVVDLAVGMWVVLGAFAAIVASEQLGIDAFALLPVVFVVFGVVGWLIAPRYTLFAFFVVVLAGLGSVVGVLVAGLFLGVLQSLVTTYVGADYTLMVVFAVLFVALLLFPQGISRRGLA